MADSERDQAKKDRPAFVQAFDTIGWGLFFVWVGIALLVDVGWGVGLVGVGIIALAPQAARVSVGLPVERMWLVMAILFVVAGAWELLKVGLGQVPIPGGLLSILSIVVGIALVGSAFLRKQKD